MVALNARVARLETALLGETMVDDEDEVPEVTTAAMCTPAHYADSADAASAVTHAHSPHGRVWSF
jgi:ribulose-5-phosphate 4-epimerase/fuculose-1-phosphate aldolase